MKAELMNGAHFSHDRKYRYALWRRWNSEGPMIMFIGLNPSTANETQNDPTIRKVCKFAKDWGFGGVMMMNLFALVTPHPEELKLSTDPVGENDRWLAEIGSQCQIKCFAWGNFDVWGRDKKVIEMFPGALALVVNKNGTPRHPLYVPANIKPDFFNKTKFIDGKQSNGEKGKGYYIQ